MATFQKLGELKDRPEITRLKRIYGGIYGAVAGLAFAVSSWGMDAYILQNAHGYYPWLKFSVGAVGCVLMGMILGWLTAYVEKTLYGVVFWLASSFFFAWLVVALPLEISPFLINRLDPQLGSLLVYNNDVDFAYRFWVAFFWAALFLFVVGIVQIPMVEPSVFSNSFFGKLAPFLFCFILMGIGGWITDSLINSYFRGATVAMNDTIQFVLENPDGKKTDPATWKKMHAPSLREAGEYLNEDRVLFVGKYDESLGIINVLVRFKGKWFDCTVVYNQPALCKEAAAP